MKDYLCKCIGTYHTCADMGNLISGAPAPVQHFDPPGAKSKPWVPPKQIQTMYGNRRVVQHQDGTKSFAVGGQAANYAPGAGQSLGTTGATDKRLAQYAQGNLFRK